MTSPANGFPNRAQPAAPASANGRSGFAAAAPVDHRTTALQSAVAILRGSSPKPKTGEIVDMANAFLNFLKASDR